MVKFVLVRTRRPTFLIVSYFVATCVLWYATTFLHVPTGFSARYFTAADQPEHPTIATVDDRISTPIAVHDWALTDQPLKARWDGYLLAIRTGTYRFSLLSDHDTRVYVDDRLLIENGDRGLRQITVGVPLGRGIHQVHVEYLAPVGPFVIEFMWAALSIDPLSSLTGLAISPKRPSPSEFLLRGATAITRLLIALSWTVVYLSLLVAWFVRPALSALVRHHHPDKLPAALLVLLIVVACLFSVAITWGIPGQGWAPDELLALDLFNGVDHLFSHGWWSKYPPVHYYVCTVVSMPLLAWRWLDPIAYGASYAPETLALLFRAVSVAMAVVIVLMVYLCAAYLYDRRSATVAAAFAALTMPMVYHAKVANVDVPYMFWFSISLASFARIGIEESPIDYVVVALMATLAVCTKDQAYGLYGLPGLALLAVAYARTTGRSPIARFAAMIGKRHLVAAAGIIVVTFAVCHNIALNPRGFKRHIDYISGVGAVPFRMFEATVTGQWQLARATWMLTRISFGWPGFLLCIIGLAWSFWRPTATQKRLWWLLLPSLSYYATFIGVVGFTYDRFLLPVFVGLALAGGFFASRVERAPARLRTWLRGGIAGALVYSFVYVAAVDVAMLKDSRYAVEAWIRANVDPGATFGRIGPIEHVPRIDGFLTRLVEPIPDAIRYSPYDYIVVNTDWIERFAANRLEHDGYVGLQEGRLGYRPVFAARQRIRFAGMAFEKRFESFGATGYSTLTKINPPTLLFRREPIRPETPAPSARTP